MTVAAPYTLPAPARTLSLPAPTPYVLRGRVTSQPPLQWPDKNPLEVEDFWLDLSAFLTPDDTLSGAVLRLDPASQLTAPYATIEGPFVGIWLAGGAPGYESEIGLTINTALSRQFVRTILLNIDLASPADIFAGPIDVAPYVPPTPAAPIPQPSVQVGSFALTIGGQTLEITGIVPEDANSSAVIGGGAITIGGQSLEMK